ncbi:hypothetical protein TNCV_1139491 [Trichonephila clavipes]|nr:hypothetical protein TNCV_1139491 [Trichonephila clavipes]
MHTAVAAGGYSKKSLSLKSSREVGGRDERWEASDPPGSSPSKLEWNRAKSLKWCSMNGVNDSMYGAQSKG